MFITHQMANEASKYSTIIDPVLAGSQHPQNHCQIDLHSSPRKITSFFRFVIDPFETGVDSNETMPSQKPAGTSKRVGFPSLGYLPLGVALANNPYIPRVM